MELSRPTLAVRGGLSRSGFDETSEALFLTSGFVYSSAEEAEAAFKDEVDRFIYSRSGNPTVAMLEERLRLLEGAEACYATASGMAAVFVALAALCGQGSRVVASRALFGSCFVILDEILPRWGVESVFVDGADLDQWATALDRPTDAVFFETPSNPMQELVDIRAVSDLAHAVGASAEGEIGHVAMGDATALSDVEETCRFAAATKVDALAVSIGTAHGYYKQTPKLDLELCRQISERLPGLPLVLHGGTGTPIEDVQKAIALGITKINVATEFQHTFLKAVQADLEAANGNFIPVDKFMDAPIERCAEHLRKLIRAFALR